MSPMPSQSSQLPDLSPSPSKNRDTQGLVSVTVKLISEASHSSDEKSNFAINGVEVTNFTIVGMAFDKNNKKFTKVNETFETKEIEAIYDGMYICLNGHLKSFQGKRPVTDFNEVTFHCIERVHFYLQNSKSQQVGTATQSQTADTSMNTPIRNGSHGNQTAPSNHVSAQFSIDGCKSWDELVIDYLMQPSSMDCIHSLESDGLIYSPVDQFHYKHVEA